MWGCHRSSIPTKIDISGVWTPARTPDIAAVRIPATGNVEIATRSSDSDLGSEVGVRCLAIIAGRRSNRYDISVCGREGYWTIVIPRRSNQCYAATESIVHSIFEDG